MRRRGGKPSEPDIEQEVPPSADDLVEKLTAILEEAEDKEQVKESIGARLYSAARMKADAPAISSMDAAIDSAIQPYEGDDELLASVLDLMYDKLNGGRRRKTRKSKRKSRKSRKYSRRR